MLKVSYGHFFCLMSMAVSFSAAAQLRENMPPVIEKPAPPPAIETPDIATAFNKVFIQAGRPRIVLMWNRELSDRIKSDVVDKKIIHEEGSSKADVIDRVTSSPTGSSLLKDSDESYQSTKTVTASKSLESNTARKNSLAERHATVLQRTFVREMNRGGVQFVDRALIMRRTAAERRTDGDPTSVEMESLITHADLMLEILLVEDKDTPAGYGFDIRIKELKRGIETASVYSRALPDEVPRKPGTWIAGQQDYEFKVPSPSERPTPAQVGVGLARDVMFALGRSLETANREPTRLQRR